MSADHPSSVADDHPTHKIDYAVRLKIDLDYPAERIWPLVLHWDRWVNETEYREYRVAGAPDTEGEIKQVIHFDQTGRLDFSFLAEVVKIIPNERLVYKILAPLSSFDAMTGARLEVAYTGYEIFEIRPTGDQVLFTFDLYAEEIRDVALAKAEARRIATDFVTATEERWYGHYFPRLRDLLAKNTPV